MLVSQLGYQRFVFLFLFLCFIFSRNGTAYKVTKSPCYDRWIKYCKTLRNLCPTNVYWIKKMCPDTCGLCKQVPACQLHKCQYYSKCKLTGVVSKCLCQNLRTCPKKHSFVCGSDNVTYRNKCTLEATACRLKMDIKISATGFCRYPCATTKCNVFARCVAISGIPKCKCPSYEDCSNIPRPICGINGVTYYNSCYWKIKSCREKVKIPIATRGRCARKLQTGKFKAASAQKNETCHTQFCPYYTVCREVEGHPTCVKICPPPICSCAFGVKYYQHLNGCVMCRCKRLYARK